MEKFAISFTTSLIEKDLDGNFIALKDAEILLIKVYKL